ncbi:MAG TPA: glycosyltransferase family 4 protein [Croceibacterium sp.]|nr:glycosyltransferase family 4 protein [Croceibacterium sp.]
MRVVQINAAIDAHGRAPEELLQAWPTVPLVAEAVALAGAEVTVLQASRQAAALERHGVRYRFVAEPRLATGNGPGLLPWRLAAEARALRPDAIHFNGLDYPLHLAWICRAGAPVLVQDHASKPGGKRAALRRPALRRVAGVAFTAEAQAEPWRRSGELPADVPVFAIPESSTLFTPGDRDEARHEARIHGDPALLWVGRLDANKDPLTILRAVRAASARLPGLQLWMAYGESELLPEIERALRSDAELAARVHLLGTVPHASMEALYRAADLFVLGSHREGSGYALIEALACGVTPVVSDIPSFRALTGDGAVGALAPCGDAEAFADRIVALAARPQRAAVLDHFARQLSPEAVGRQLVAAYRAIARS